MNGTPTARGHRRPVGLALAAAGLLAAAEAGAETFVYREADGTRWITDRRMPPERFEFVSRYGRPTATASCRGVTPAIMEKRAQPHMAWLKQQARHHDLDPRLIKAVIAAESCFDTQAVSTAGARGLMQLMPATARRYGVTNRFNPRESIRAGVHHLRNLMDYFREDRRLSVAAYNAGAKAVERYNGVPPYEETQTYLKRVMAFYRRFRGKTASDRRE